MASFPWTSVTPVFFCLALLTATAVVAARPLVIAPAPVPAAPLAEQRRLDAAGQQQCWETLMQIKSCTGEIILFLHNGEAYLGPACCRAVSAIEQRCWAADAMLSVIGFTPQEGDMLKGYCDAGDDDQGHGAALQPPRRAVLDDGGDAAVASRKDGPVHG